MKRSILAAALAAYIIVPAAADLYSPDRGLHTLETEYFSFVFPEESRPAVEYLAGFADDAYREIAGLLGTTPARRLPVVMTPDSEELNGYFTWQPYLRIVLYQAPMDPGSTLGSFNDDLRKLFYHELTHAVSMTIRSGLENAIVGVFGSPLGASSYLAPLSFVEGVTVSFESRDGFGRAADPLSGAYLRQDIVEGRWKTFVQASGAYDRYPYGGLYYLYGGYFSRYLQERYGMEKYAALWREFGAASIFRSLDDGLLGEGRFSRIYGLSLSEAWDGFKDSMTPRVPVYMAAEPLRPLGLVSALAARGGALYYADEASATVYAYDPASGAERALFRAGSEVSRIDVSGDGLRLLLSTRRVEAGFPRLVVKEWDAATGRLTDLPTRKLRDAAYLGGSEAVVGIAIDGYQTDLALARGEDTTILLSGSERISYSSPVASGDGRTVYTVAREVGRASVVRLAVDPASGSVASAERLSLPEGLSWIRYLSLGDDGALRFSWDDQNFYRLAELDGDGLRYETVPISGGVHKPVASNGRVYYLGRFSAGVAPCAFPEDRTPLGFAELEAAWEDAAELLSAASVYDEPPALESGRYHALRWLAPRFWLPAASVSLDGLETVGLILFAADPAERLNAVLGVDWNLRASAVDFELSATWSRFALPVRVSVADSFKVETAERVVRTSTASLGLEHQASFFSGGGLGWSVRSGVLAQGALAPGQAAYSPWETASAMLEASASWTDAAAPLADPEARTGYGTSLLARVDAQAYPVFGTPSIGAEASLSGYLGSGALIASVYGAAAVIDGVAYGPRGRRYPGMEEPLEGSYPAWNEFKAGGSGPWFAEGEASLRLLGAEIQRGLGSLYVNRLSIRSGGRAYLVSGPLWTDGAGEFGYSAFGRARLTWTPAIGALANVHLGTVLELWCRPDLAADASLPHGVTFELSASY